jgi:hypothetical protein
MSVADHARPSFEQATDQVKSSRKRVFERSAHPRAMSNAAHRRLYQ